MTRAAASSPPPPPPPPPPPCTSRACAGAWDQPSTRRAVTAWVADARHGRCGGARQQAAIARPCFHCCARAASCPPRRRRPRRARCHASRRANHVPQVLHRSRHLESVRAENEAEQCTQHKYEFKLRTRAPRIGSSPVRRSGDSKVRGGWKHDDSWSWSRVQLDLHGGRRALDARWVARTR